MKRTPFPRPTLEQVRAAEERKRARRRERVEATRKDRSRRRALPRVNAKRKARLFVEQFHSAERVEFFQHLPCDVTGIVNPERVQNAHVVKSRGAGGDYLGIVPLLDEVHHDFDNLSAAKFEAKRKRTKASVKARAPFYHELWEAA